MTKITDERIAEIKAAQAEAKRIANLARIKAIHKV